MTLVQVIINLILAALAYAATQSILSRTQIDRSAALLLAVLVAIIVFVINVAARLGVV